MINFGHSRDRKVEAKKDELSEKISDFSSKTESLLGPADVGPPGLSRFGERPMKGSGFRTGECVPTVVSRTLKSGRDRCGISYFQILAKRLSGIRISLKKSLKIP